MSLNLLAFFAHPDDETMLCGGTLALLARLGARVHIMVATRGEGGEMGEPEVCTRAELGQVRENELRCAAKALNAASLTLMDYRDPLIGPDDSLFSYTDDLDTVANQIAEAIRYRKAEVVFTHGINGEYGHPAHVFSHRAACQGVANLGAQAPLLYTVQGAFAGHPFPLLANADAPAHMIIDASAVAEQKTAAALCHCTQHALFVRRKSEEVGRQLTVPEVIVNLESLHRILPAVNGTGRIHDSLADLLWASGYASAPEIRA